MIGAAFVRSLLAFGLASSALVLTADAIRCYSCEISSSEISYVDAEKRCNSRGPSDCQNPQHKACMTEAFTTKRESTSSSSSSSSSSFNVVKKCLIDCPVFVNSTAEHIRCCLETACNNLIFIETVDESTAQPRQGRQLGLPEGSPLPSPSSEDQPLPPSDNEDEGPPSMMRPNIGGRFPPPGPNDPGRRHVSPQLHQQQQQQPMPGPPPGGMRPPQPPPEMGGDERQRHGGGGGPGPGSGAGRGGGGGAGTGGLSSNGSKSASSRLVIPSLIQFVAFVVVSSAAAGGMRIQK